MKLKLLLLILSCMGCWNINSQTNFNKQWALGFQVISRSDFNTTPVTNSWWVDTFYYGLHIGSSGICDSSGQLAFTCNGCMVFDKNMQIMEGGDTVSGSEFAEYMFGFSTAAQTSIILPFPGRKYKIIIGCASDYEVLYRWPSVRVAFDELSYSEVDMNLNGGLGKVTKSHQVFYLDTTAKGLSKTQMGACRHANGKDWWVLKQAQDTNLVLTFLVTADTIELKHIQGFSSPHFMYIDNSGQSTFSEDGSKYVSGCRISEGQQFFLADFDRCTGLLYNPQSIHFPDTAGTYGKMPDNLIDSMLQSVAFSPNGRFIYRAGACNIYQYDLQDQTWYHVAKMDTTAYEFGIYSTLQLGADGKLYVGNWSGLFNQISVIEYPNVKGAACGWCPKCMVYPSTCCVTTPPYMPNYDLGAETCWPLSASPSPSEGGELLVVYPNPASTSITMSSEALQGKLVKVSFYNMLGQELMSNECHFVQQNYTLNIQQLPRGVYLLNVGEWVRRVVVE